MNLDFWWFLTQCQPRILVDHPQELRAFVACLLVVLTVLIVQHVYRKSSFTFHFRLKRLRFKASCIPCQPSIHQIKLKTLYIYPLYNVLFFMLRILHIIGDYHGLFTKLTLSLNLCDLVATTQPVWYLKSCQGKARESHGTRIFRSNHQTSKWSWAFGFCCSVSLSILRKVPNADWWWLLDHLRIKFRTSTTSLGRLFDWCKDA